MSKTPQPGELDRGGIVFTETNPRPPSTGVLEAMARRRFQKPQPVVHGKWWTIRVTRRELRGGKETAHRTREIIGPATMLFREAQKVAEEMLGPMNHERSAAAAMPFEEYVNAEYIPNELPLMAASTRSRYVGVLRKYLIPTFGSLLLRDMTRRRLQNYFSGLASSPLAYESKDKIRTVLSSVLASAVRYEILNSNPAEKLRLPPARTGLKVKPHITPAQFNALLELIPEPYASMVFVSTLTGLRISELAGLRWNDVREDSITIDERFCRGDWGAPKSNASNATVPVLPAVIQRIHRLKTLTVRIGGGRGGHQSFRVVKSDAPESLVFQSVRKGAPMRDNNILSRHLKPAAAKLGIPWVNWRCLRTSFATLLKERGVHIRDAQALMRHSKASTTLDIYMQTPDASQRAAVAKLESVAGSTMVQ